MKYRISFINMENVIYGCQLGNAKCERVKYNTEREHEMAKRL